MSDHTTVIIWVIRSFLYSSSVYSCHLFLISSASVRSIPFLSFIEPVFGIFNFLEEIFSLSHSIVFLYFSALIAEEGLLISPCCSLGLCIQMLLSFLFSFAYRFSFQSYLQRLFRQPFCFFALLFHGDVLGPFSCTMS